MDTRKRKEESGRGRKGTQWREGRKVGRHRRRRHEKEGEE